MTAYYNEHDADKAAWLRELIKGGVVAPGEVDERSIKDVAVDDLRGYRQCHFFAGIGVWSYALRLAGWPDDRAVWTGSCPCPSFSAAGKGLGFRDPRHLWPDWWRLIGELSPAVVFGEQVSAAIGHGWLDLVQSDLEGADYAVGKAVLGACSVGAPHIRQRLFFVANADYHGCDSLAGNGLRNAQYHAEPCCGVGEHRNSPQSGIGAPDGQSEPSHGREGEAGGSGVSRDCQYAEGLGRREGWPESKGIKGRPDAAEYGIAGLGDLTLGARLEGHFGDEREWRGPGWLDPREARSVAEAGATRGFWAECDWWYGRDGKYRPAGPGIQPLAHGAAARVLRLRGYGDAISPWPAAEFIASVRHALAECST